MPTAGRSSHKCVWAYTEIKSNKVESDIMEEAMTDHRPRRLSRKRKHCSLESLPRSVGRNTKLTFDNIFSICWAPKITPSKQTLWAMFWHNEYILQEMTLADKRLFVDNSQVVCNMFNLRLQHDSRQFSCSKCFAPVPLSLAHTRCIFSVGHIHLRQHCWSYMCIMLEPFCCQRNR